MRAAYGMNYGPVDDMVHVVDDAPKPNLRDALGASKSKDWAIIRTLAVALAPGDVRVLSGKTKEFQGPKAFPHVLGGDVCGQIVELPQSTSSSSNEEGDSKKSKANSGNYFQVGDVVLARFYEKPIGAMGEYALIHTKCCDRIPAGMSPEEAAALGSSGVAAMCISKRINPGERILVLGAGGGVGSHFIQLAKNVSGASYVMGVSNDSKRLTAKPLSCDASIDYTNEDPFTFLDRQINSSNEEPFDVVVDFAGIGWKRLLEERKRRKKTGSSPIVKSAKEGGRYLTCATEQPWFEIHSIWGILKLFVFQNLWRAMYSRLPDMIGGTRSTLPSYSFVMALPSNREPLTETMQLVRDKLLVPSIDPRGPFPFTTQGVREAMKLQESRHAKGKVVVHVADL